MLEICTHQFLFFKRKELWFYNSEKIKKGTYNVFCYSNEEKVIVKENVLIEQTSQISLEKPSEELFGRINRTFKYHIHKAERIGIKTKIDYSPTMQKCLQVMKELSAFTGEKKIEWNPKRIEALQKLNKLIISEAFLEKARIVTHIYLHDDNRVVLLHSYHHHNFSKEKLGAYANKLLHWIDILNFKKFGLKLYDFGGINMLSLPGISKFKLSFGGEVIDTYSYVKAHPLVISAIGLYKRIRK